MMLCIHLGKNSFSQYWVDYCVANNIPYRIIDPYATTVMSDTVDCDAILWHFSHMNAKDYLAAKQILNSLEFSGKIVFPDNNTAWHFDDKIAQKYLLEGIHAPLVPSFVFYNKAQALKWIDNATFPIVAKLRGGAGSVNVKLLKSLSQAKSYVAKAFGKGFEHTSLFPFEDVYRRFREGKASLWDVTKSIGRKFIKTEFSRIYGRAVGYVYFQKFLHGNDHDIRIIVIDNKAFAMKRMNRPNDFRASGSGNFQYKKDLFDPGMVKKSLELAKQLKSQCLAIDYVFENKIPFIVEISFGFVKKVYDECEGYWDSDMNWHEGKFNPQGWIIDLVLKQVEARKKVS